MDKGVAQIKREVVSSEQEQLILVDEQDREIGHASKAEVHNGDGQLHRAFSLFIFDPDGRLLLQQRSAQKRLWPLYWSNSCCSHPRRGESMDEAAERRLYEELHLRCSLEFLYKFIYHASYGEEGSEYEHCWVYAGRTAERVRVNVNEIADWRYLHPEQLDAEMSETPEHFTPWLKLEWERIRRDFLGRASAASR